MKYYPILIVVILFMPNIVSAQKTLPFKAGTHKVRNRVISGNIDVTFGVAPKQSVQAFKGTVSVNNVLQNRIGFYTSFEQGIANDYSANTIGTTLTIINRVYLWAGMDFITTKGFLYKKQLQGPRKEIGVGFLPYKKMIFRAGWSQSVGFTLTGGVRITFEQIKELNQPH